MVEIKYDSQKGTGETNQDFILCKQLDDSCLIFILADGMGGLQHGDIAAKIVAQSICETFAKYKSDNIRNTFIEAFRCADSAIADKCKYLHCKMGAAVTVLIIKGDTAYYAWQGNVRLYGKQNGNYLILTEDHVKKVTDNTLLTRCVNGKGFRYPISIKEKSLFGISLLFICSDGFYLSKDCMTQINEGVLSTSVERTEDDASYIQIKIT